MLHAFQGTLGDYIGFDLLRRANWGFQTRRQGDRYYLDGLKRRTSAKHPAILFQYTLDGYGEYGEGEKRWTVSPGSGFMTILPSDHWYCLPAGSDHWTFFFFNIRHPFATDRVQALLRKENAVQEWTPNSLFLELGASLFEACCQGKLREVWSFEEMFFTWLLQMERELHHRRYPQDERQRMLDETRQIVCGRLEKPPDVAELADMHQMERTTFSRKFKTTTGLSPAAFVTEVRLDQALKLLRSKAKLKDIAAETGFSDANHFCKVFRRHFHSSPGAYRRLILSK